VFDISLISSRRNSTGVVLLGRLELLAELLRAEGIEELAHNIFNKWLLWYQLLLSNIHPTTRTSCYDPMLPGLFHHGAVFCIWFLGHLYTSAVVCGSFISSLFYILFRSWFFHLSFWLHLIFTALRDSINFPWFRTLFHSRLLLRVYKIFIVLSKIALNLCLLCLHLWLIFTSTCIMILNQN